MSFIDDLVEERDCLKAELDLQIWANKVNSDANQEYEDYLKSQLSVAKEALNHIDAMFCEGNAEEHGKCEQSLRDRARLALQKLRETGE